MAQVPDRRSQPRIAATASRQERVRRKHREPLKQRPSRPAKAGNGKQHDLNNIYTQKIHKKFKKMLQPAKKSRHKC
jgi:hypothetical protein